MAGRHCRGRAGGGASPSRGPRIADSGGRGRHRRVDLARAAAARTRPAFLYFQRRLCGILFRAAQKLAAFPGGRVQDFDLEKPGTEQGFEAGAFDLVLGANVLHAVSEVRVALHHVHELLKPGGSLLFIDTATPELWTEVIFGLTGGWWRFKDHDLRPFHPLLDRSQWEAVLRESGFAEAASVPGPIGPTGGEGQMAVLARKAWDETASHGPAAAETDGQAPEETSWLVFADHSDLAARLISRLRESGARYRVVHRGSQFATDGANAFTLRADMPEDWKRLLEACADDAPPQRMVYLWTLNDSAHDDPVLLGTDALLNLTQAIKKTRPSAKLRIDLITRGAQAVGRTTSPIAVRQAPALGLLRVMLNEHPQFTCRAIDLSPSASASDDLRFGMNCCGTTLNAKSPFAVKHAIRGVLAVAGYTVSNGSNQRLRCDSNHVTGDISTRCIS